MARSSVLDSWPHLPLTEATSGVQMSGKSGRTVLNYKRIPYKTVWLSYPDIEPVLKLLGAAATSVIPGSDGKPWYTLPAIVYPHVYHGGIQRTKPQPVTDSINIAEYLDSKFPERPVFPKTPRERQEVLDFQHYFWKTAGSHLPPLMIPLAMNILDERSQVYFRTTREQWYGKKLEEFSPEGTIRDTQWERVRLGFEDVAARLKTRNGVDAEFVLGGTVPTRADLLIVSFLAWIVTVSPEEGWDQRVRNWSHGRWERLWRKAEDEGWTVVPGGVPFH